MSTQLLKYFLNLYIKTLFNLIKIQMVLLSIEFRTPSLIAEDPRFEPLNAGALLAPISISSKQLEQLLKTGK